MVAGRVRPRVAVVVDTAVDEALDVVVAVAVIDMVLWAGRERGMVTLVGNAPIATVEQRKRVMPLGRENEFSATLVRKPKLIA